MVIYIAKKTQHGYINIHLPNYSVQSSNNIGSTNKCSNCGRQIYSSQTIAMIQKNSSPTVPFFDVPSTCHSCINNLHQLRRQTQANDKIRNYHEMAQAKRNITMSEDIVENFNPSQLLSKCNELSDLHCFTNLNVLKKPIKVKIASISTDEIVEGFTDSVINGGYFQVPIDDVSIRSRTIMLEEDLDGLLIKLPIKDEKKNIFLFGTSISIEQMIEIADNERSNMATGNLVERAGSSGEFVFSNSNSKSLTSCTNASERNKSLLVPCPNSVGATIHYQQDDGKYRKFAGVYNQTKGKRYNKIEKSVQIKERASYTVRPCDN